MNKSSPSDGGIFAPKQSVKLTKYICTGFTVVVFILNIYGRIATGACPAYEPLDSFDAEKFTGVWYELQRDVNFRSSSGECVTAQYELRGEQAGVSVVNNERVYEGNDSADGERSFIEGYALASSFFPGKLAVYFFGGFGASYRVVDTDYDSYAVIYSCE